MLCRKVISCVSCCRMSCVEIYGCCRDGLIGEKTEGGMLLVERVKAACSVINGCEQTDS